MTTSRLIERLRALPDDVTEREVGRVIWRVLSLRLLLGFTALVAWRVVLWKFVSLEPKIVESIVSDAGSLLIFVAAIYPLIRIMRMSDEEFERVIEARPGWS